MLDVPIHTTKGRMTPRKHRCDLTSILLCSVSIAKLDSVLRAPPRQYRRVVRKPLGER